MLIYSPMSDNDPGRFHGYSTFLSQARASTCFLGFTAALLMTGVPPTIAKTMSPLTARGYSVLPIPQKLVLGQGDFEISDAWHIVLQGGVKSDDVAVESLKQGLNDRARLHLSEGSVTGNGAGVIR